MNRPLIHRMHEHYGTGFYETKEMLRGELLRKMLGRLERNSQYDEDLNLIHNILYMIVEDMYKKLPDNSFDQEIENLL